MPSPSKRTYEVIDLTGEDDEVEVPPTTIPATRPITTKGPRPLSKRVKRSLGGGFELTVPQWAQSTPAPPPLPRASFSRPSPEPERKRRKRSAKTEAKTKGKGKENERIQVEVPDKAAQSVATASTPPPISAVVTPLLPVVAKSAAASVPSSSSSLQRPPPPTIALYQQQSSVAAVPPLPLIAPIMLPTSAVSKPSRPVLVASAVASALIPPASSHSPPPPSQPSRTSRTTALYLPREAVLPRPLTSLIMRPISTVPKSPPPVVAASAVVSALIPQAPAPSPSLLPPPSPSTSSHTAALSLPQGSVAVVSPSPPTPPVIAHAGPQIFRSIANTATTLETRQMVQVPATELYHLMSHAHCENTPPNVTRPKASKGPAKAPVLPSPAKSSPKAFIPTPVLVCASDEETLDSSDDTDIWADLFG